VTASSLSISTTKAAISTQIRARRAKMRALKQRRDALLNLLARSLPLPFVPADFVTGRDAFTLVAGHLVGAKPVAARVARRAVLRSGRTLNHSALMPRRDVMRPSRIVAEASRPCVIPGLVTESPDHQLLSVEEAIAAAMEDAAAGRTAFRVLNRFRSTTDLGWEIAAAMLVNAGVFRDQLSAETMSMTAEARRFWERWQLARVAYHAAVHLGQVRQIGGDWGLLEVDDVGELRKRPPERRLTPGGESSASGA
jgi:hypothetical protein